MGQKTCANHPDAEAAWWCQTCGGFWCGACSARGDGKPHCPRCGSRTVSLNTGQPQATAKAPLSLRAPPQPASKGGDHPGSFYSSLGAALLYPIKGTGREIIAGWVVFNAILAILSFFPLIGLITSLIGLFVTAYVCAYVFTLISSSASGEDDPPDWPDIHSIWDDIFRPAALLAATLLVVFLPTWIWLLFPWICSFFNISTDESSLLRFIGSLTLLRLLVVLGAMCLPMTLLSVAMYNGLGGLNPVRILVAIVKVLGPYLVVCVLMILVLAGYIAFGYLPRIPVVSRVLSAGVFMYFLMVEMRLVGLIYRFYMLRLNWFDEVTDKRMRRSREK